MEEPNVQEGSGVSPFRSERFIVGVAVVVLLVLLAAGAAVLISHDSRRPGKTPTQAQRTEISKADCVQLRRLWKRYQGEWDSFVEPGFTAYPLVTERMSKLGCDSSRSVQTTPTTQATSQSSDPFVGDWRVHDAQMEIRPDMTGIVRINCGGAVCVESDRLSLTRSRDGRRLTARITAIGYSDDKGRPVPNPDPSESAAVGDSFYLEFVAPHLMKQTMIRTSRPLGNPYWCGDGLADSRQRVCGA